MSAEKKSVKNNIDELFLDKAIDSFIIPLSLVDTITKLDAFKYCARYDILQPSYTIGNLVYPDKSVIVVVCTTMPKGYMCYTVNGKMFTYEV